MIKINGADFVEVEQKQRLSDYDCRRVRLTTSNPVHSVMVQRSDLTQGDSAFRVDTISN